MTTSDTPTVRRPGRPKKTKPTVEQNHAGFTAERSAGTAFNGAVLQDVLEPDAPHSARHHFTAQADALVLSDALRQLGIVHTITVNGDYLVVV